MRVVVDTNVLVSAVLSSTGLPALILDLIFSREVTLILSPAILAEYEEVLTRDEFYRLREEKVRQVLRRLQIAAEVVSTKPHPVSLPDPDDQPFLACAIEGRAHYLITGNKKHFPASLCKPISVVSPAEFLEKLK
jgi:putative PIN family toxin of toxin-antitoxin system